MNTSPVIIGQNIQRERQRQRLSLDDLAQRSDVSKGMLSLVERGEKNPTVALLARIAKGLRVEFSRLLPESENSPRVWRVVRAGDENYVFVKTKDCTLRTLSPLELEKEIEFYELTLGPHGQLESEPHFQGAEEILTVAKGHLKVRSGGQETEIRRGDSVHYAADVAHTITNLGAGEAVAFMIVRWQK